MKTLIRKKLLENETKVGLRSYEIDHLISNNESVKVVIDNPSLPEHNQYMILTPRELKQGKVINTQQSKFSDQTYLLLEFAWKGIKDLDENPGINFETKKRLSEDAVANYVLKILNEHNYI